MQNSKVLVHYGDDKTIVVTINLQLTVKNDLDWTDVLKQIIIPVLDKESNPMKLSAGSTKDINMILTILPGDTCE